MERFQQKRSRDRERHSRGYASKITNLADQKSGSNLVLMERARGGNRLIRNRRDSPKLASDSSSCSSGTTYEDLFASDLRRSSSKLAGGTPMKKLLAEELSKEMESLRRPPSVIARLMGFDGMPPQQPVHKHQKRFSENYLQRTASIGLQGNSSCYVSHSFGKNVREQQEFKDVFEDLEASKAERQGTTNSKLTEAEVAFIRQKFMDAKRLSTDEKLQHSKEFHDALEVLDSNKDLLLKFLQEPDSLFTKHIHDMQGVPPHSGLGHKSVLKSSNNPKCENIDIWWKSERKTERMDVTDSLLKHDNGIVSHSHSKHGIHNSHKNSKSGLGGKDEICLLPTRIVVLKPNLGKAQNAARSVSSPSSSEGFQSGHRKHKEITSSQNRVLFAEVRERKTSSNNVELLRHRSRGSREIANEITRNMRHNVSSGFVKVSRSGIRGYAGDESSCYTSGNDSAKESDVGRQTSRNVFGLKDRYSPSSSYSTESSVSREAKKRLSERWKMTHRFQEVGLVSRGSTLGEMLAKPDREMRPMSFDSLIGEDGAGDRFARNDGGSRRSSPLGISSRDGWKDVLSGTLPRSKSLPASSTAFGSPKASIRQGAFGNDRCLMPKEAINQGTSKSRRRNSNQKDSSFSRNPIYGSKESQSSLWEDRVSNNIVEEIQISLDVPGNNLQEKDVSEKPMVHEPSAGSGANTTLVPDIVAKSEPTDVSMSSETPEELLPEPTTCVLLVKNGDPSAHDPYDSIPQETSNGRPVEVSVPSPRAVTEPESPASCKEADNPSPVSVLEPPFVEEISSDSECFDKVSSDLQGLRIQLQLLKLESSEAYTEGLGMIVSSDEDTGEGSIGLPAEKEELMGVFRAKENRDLSYLFDVLVDSGFHGANLENALATWYSLECPVSLLVFETLEKKYGEQISWTRSARKLLFDRINSGLMEILRLCMDPHPWVKPERKKISPRQCTEALEEELWNLLDSRGKEASEGSSEKVVIREMKWLELGDEIDVIGREIERLLTDEVISEAVSMLGV
ncbi:hypothetical protein HHK36_016475 [Tetracentron sinense]|uniref:DUF4378 domain-containing protein n=1 Tax=Tetracentron sinense TaxID=13715 RepID=A0A834Z2T8_TETSI|nr:hypothetical protein HHK36_016475 [Tetracentron sinense]